MKLMKMKNLILALVVSISVIALVQYIGERRTRYAEASSILNLQVVMTGCVEEAKVAWVEGMNYPKLATGTFYGPPAPPRDDSTAVAILAAEMFRQRVEGGR